jgi:hypothetical protein
VNLGHCATIASRRAWIAQSIPNEPVGINMKLPEAFGHVSVRCAQSLGRRCFGEEPEIVIGPEEQAVRCNNRIAHAQALKQCKSSPRNSLIA